MPISWEEPLDVIVTHLNPDFQVDNTASYFREILSDYAATRGRAAAR